MKFPINRTQLQQYDHVTYQNEQREEQLQRSLTKLLEKLCEEFKQMMPSSSREKRFIWRNMHMRINPKDISRFIDKVKEQFIGCDIIIDPLNTYMIIDWS